MGTHNMSSIQPKHKIFFSILIIFQQVSAGRKSTCDFVNEAELSSPLTCETHKTQTVDGYNLEIYRITGHKITKNKPVLLAHGLFGSSDIFVLTGGDHGIAFQLVNEGYDVLLVNFRGNRYSLGHEKRNTLSGKIKHKLSGDYWRFSFWEMGIYDLPAMIELILKASDSEQLHYVGFSMGTLTLFIGMDFYGRINSQNEQLTPKQQLIFNAQFDQILPSEYQSKLSNYDLQSKISDFQCIGPVFKMKHFSNTKLRKYNAKFYDKLQSAEFLQGLKFVPKLLVNNPAMKAVGMEKILKKLDFVKEMANLNPENYIENEEARTELYNHVPQGTSMQTVLHFSKLIQENRLAPFHDVRLVFRNESTGKVGLKLFELRLKYVKKVPTFVYYGEIDNYSPRGEAAMIKRLMGKRNLVQIFKVKKADHMGLVGGKTIRKGYVMKMMKKMEKYD